MAVSIKHTDADAARYRLAAAGDKAARNALAEEHLGLVQNLATYYAKRNPHLVMDDLIQEGRIGVVWALDRFDVDKGYRFSTYATYWIKHFIQRYMIANHSGGATTSKKDTEAYVGRTMSDEDRKVYEARCIEHMSLSGDTAGGTNFEEIIEDKDVVPVDEAITVRVEWQGIERALLDDSVPPRARAVVCMRYGVMGFRTHTLKEVADKLEIPAARVSAIEQTTVKHLSLLLEENDGNDDDEALGSGGAEGEAEGGPGERSLLHAPRNRAC